MAALKEEGLAALAGATRATVAREGGEKVATEAVEAVEALGKAAGARRGEEMGAPPMPAILGDKATSRAHVMDEGERIFCKTSENSESQV